MVNFQARVLIVVDLQIPMKVFQDCTPR